MTIKDKITKKEKILYLMVCILASVLLSIVVCMFYFKVRWGNTLVEIERSTTIIEQRLIDKK